MFTVQQSGDVKTLNFARPTSYTHFFVVAQTSESEWQLKGRQNMDFRKFFDGKKRCQTESLTG